MNERHVAVALLTRAPSRWRRMREVKEPEYERALTTLIVGAHLTMTNGRRAIFPQAKRDWIKPIVGFAVYDLEGDTMQLLFRGPLDNPRTVKASDCLAFEIGSLVLQVTV